VHCAAKNPHNIYCSCEKQLAEILPEDKVYVPKGNRICSALMVCTVQQNTHTISTAALKSSWLKSCLRIR
jgi:hypothetical protein